MQTVPSFCWTQTAPPSPAWNSPNRAASPTTLTKTVTQTLAIPCSAQGERWEGEKFGHSTKLSSSGLPQPNLALGLRTTPAAHHFCAPLTAHHSLRTYRVSDYCHCERKRLQCAVLCITRSGHRAQVCCNCL